MAKPKTILSYLNAIAFIKQSKQDMSEAHKIKDPKPNKILAYREIGDKKYELKVYRPEKTLQVLH